MDCPTVTGVTKFAIFFAGNRHAGTLAATKKPYNVDLRGSMDPACGRAAIDHRPARPGSNCGDHADQNQGRTGQGPYSSSHASHLCPMPQTGASHRGPQKICEQGHSRTRFFDCRCRAAHSQRRIASDGSQPKSELRISPRDWNFMATCRLNSRLPA